MYLPHNFVFQGVDAVGNGVKGLVEFAGKGAGEVFGGLRTVSGVIFAIEIGAIILLFGGLLSVLYHIGVMQAVIWVLATSLIGLFILPP